MINLPSSPITVEIKSPVLFLFFNRPTLTRLVFDKIRAVKPKTLILASDGPREHVPKEALVIANLRNELENKIDWPVNLETDYTEKNLGCGLKVSTAIANALSRHGRAIILEDDCLPSLSFFSFCDHLLKIYQNETRITSINGSYFFKKTHKKVDVGFTHFPSIWGWATWARTWEGYDLFLNGWDDSFFDEISQSGIIPSFLKKELKKTFSLIVKNPYSTWDFQFMLLSFKKRGLAAFPYKNMIRNIGMNVQATHTTGNNPLGNIPEFELKSPYKIPNDMSVDLKYEQFQIKYYSNKTTWRNFFHKVIYKSLIVYNKYLHYYKNHMSTKP